ncbi:hypothetical protein [Lysobacter hankyongensis]|uniref:Lipoprotein n=1 Tax=Lysobacter hankyongensis TaxID=1176535 RepID=A0ABP9CD64_9GAMM
MNARRFLPLVLAIATVFLPGCRTMDESAVAPPPARIQTAPAQVATTYQPRIEEDARYVAYVENMARRRGIIVRWVNKPVKRHVDVPTDRD